MRKLIARVFGIKHREVTATMDADGCIVQFITEDVVLFGNVVSTTEKTIYYPFGI